MQNTLNNIIAKYDLGSTNVFFAPNIPEKKLFNAISTYAPTVSSADVVLLLDDTVWGGAKEGMLLSKEQLFFHELLTAPRSLPLSDIQNIWPQKSDLYFNNKKYISCIQLDKKYAEVFCSLLFELICALRNECSAERMNTVLKAGDNAIPQGKENERNEAVNTKQLPEDVKDIFDKYSFVEQKIFFFPRIPEQKLLNAVNSYATQIHPDEVLVLLDDTLMGGAKEGMILTREYVFFHELLTDPVAIKLDDVESVIAKDNSLHINNRHVFKVTQFRKIFLKALGNMINDIADLRLTDEKRAEKQLIKQLGARHEYYFHGLVTSLPKRSKLDSMSNSIDVFLDQFLYISVQQGNEAWARDAKIENEFREAFDTAAYSLLKLAFMFSKRISAKLNNDKVCTLIAMSDCVIHEILIGFLFKGLDLISKYFANHSDRDALLGLYSEDLFMKRILIPFYQFKISNEDRLNSLEKTSLLSDIMQVVHEVIKNRRMLQNIDNLSEFTGFAINNHISERHSNSDIQSIMLLSNTPSNDENINNALISNCKQTLVPYCDIVSSCIFDEVEVYFEDSEERLADIIENFLI